MYVSQDGGGDRSEKNWAVTGKIILLKYAKFYCPIFIACIDARLSASSYTCTYMALFYRLELQKTIYCPGNRYIYRNVLTNGAVNFC